MILTLVVVLLLFGGKKLPEMARGLGKGIREFKDALEDIKHEVSAQIDKASAQYAETSDKSIDNNDLAKASHDVNNIYP